LRTSSRQTSLLNAGSDHAGTHASLALLAEFAKAKRQNWPTKRDPARNAAELFHDGTLPISER